VFAGLEIVGRGRPTCSFLNNILCFSLALQRRAYSYTRFSTLKQEQGDSERRQIESARLYAAERGYPLDESIAVDRGKSVWTGKNISEGALGEFI
jgi:hypothetical protein